MADLPATELLSLNDAGRWFDAERTVRLGDVDTSGHLRLDAIARYLQDVASDDALDAGLDNAMGWVVRRTMIRVDQAAELNDHVGLTTFCSGSGRSWAERRTTVKRDRVPIVEAVSLWVQIDVVTGRPAKLGDEFDRIYGGAAAGRTVSSKLVLGRPPDDADHEPWAFRRSDLDPFAHVNNAAQWAVIEHMLADRERRGIGVVEFVGAAGIGDADLIRDRDRAWLRQDGRVVSAFEWIGRRA